MGYKGSYLWTVRQKVGHDRLINATVDTIAVREDGKILLCYSNEFDAWTTPGGSTEFDKTWRQSALDELMEEGGLLADVDDLVPFAASSGAKWSHEYKNGDKLQSFSLAFICKKWTDQSGPTDTEEITKKQFFSLEEIKELRLSKFAKPLIEAYQRYLDTGEFQMIDLE